MGLISSALGSVGSSVLDFLSGGLLNMWNANTNYGYSKRMARYNADLSKELTEFGNDLTRNTSEWWSLNSPKFTRSGLESAGYNPILAVSSAGGSSPVSQPVAGSAGGSVSGGSSGRVSSLLENLQRIKQIEATDAQIHQTNAQTNLTEKRTLGEGWTIKTLTAGEARGLGANLLGRLGFNFNGSEHQTFLVAYNPITGELRNLGSTRDGSFGSSGEVNNAADIPEGTVDVKFEPIGPSATNPFPKGRKHN